MKMRRLGSTGLDIAPLVFGGNVFGWTIDEATSGTLLDAFVAAGFNAIDTADFYSAWVPENAGGESETIIGNWLQRSGKRDDVVIATKVGMEMGPGMSGLSKKYIIKAAEASLRRLRTDRIDLYQAHRDDTATNLEETLEAFSELIKQGKVKAIGASNYTGERLAKALRLSEEHGLPAYSCLQPHYNLYERQSYEDNLEPVCTQAGLGVIPYFSLASGFLTGKYRSEQDLVKSQRGEGNRKYLNPRGLRILAALDQVAAEHNSTMARVALAWLLARPSVTAPIVSATTVTQLEDILGAAHLKLEPSAVQVLNRASVAAL